MRAKKKLLGKCLHCRAADLEYRRLRGIDCGWCPACGIIMLSPAAELVMLNEGLTYVQLLCAAPVVSLATAVKRELPDYGEQMTVREFGDSIDTGSFTDDDGYGVFATRTKRTHCSVWPSTFVALRQAGKLPKWATHVLWFNK